MVVKQPLLSARNRTYGNMGLEAALRGEYTVPLV